MCTHRLAAVSFFFDYDFKLTVWFDLVSLYTLLLLLVFNWFLFLSILMVQHLQRGKNFSWPSPIWVCVWVCPTNLTIRLIRNVFVIAHNMIAVYYHKTNVYILTVMYVIISFFPPFFRKVRITVQPSDVVHCASSCVYVVHIIYFDVNVKECLSKHLHTHTHVHAHTSCLCNDIITFHFINIYSVRTLYRLNHQFTKL